MSTIESILGISLEDAKRADEKKPVPTSVLLDRSPIIPHAPSNYKEQEHLGIGCTSFKPTKKEGATA
jgi:hypothetical protein